MKMRRLALAVTAAIAAASLAAAPGRTAEGPTGATPEFEPEVWIGSKTFTESVVLGELIAHLARTAGGAPIHRRQLGGTRVLWHALLAGEIDVYPEYTGTLSQEILAGEGLTSEAEIREALAARRILMSQPLGFNNSYAIGMREDQAARRGIVKISDLRRFPGLVFGFGNEFMDRADGWPSLRQRYGLPHGHVRGLDHDLAYRGLESGDIDVTDAYTTDAEVSYYGLRLLEDDLGHFPVYNAVIIHRADLERRAPAVVAAIKRLEGLIGDVEMARMNARVKLDRESETRVAADFLQANLGIAAETNAETWIERLWHNTLAHLGLVAISLSAAVVIAIPLGIVAARRERIGQVILGVVGIVQTIPSLALFVFMIPLLGIGGPPAIMALFLYSLLPIVRNTHAGLHDIPLDIRESAMAVGLPPSARLRLIELPMAGRAILAGLKTSAVINVGTATLAALIGAGGYGQPILTGIRLDDIGLILQGAVPAAVLALMVQGLFEGAERLVVPKGLRLRAEA
jgi:osmoprotectant transport system permease protein